MTNGVRRDWRVAVASVAGTAHLANSALCQDRAEVRFAEGADDDALVAIVADGAGSAAGAAIGAELAAIALADLAVDYLRRGGPVAGLTKPTATAWIDAIVYTLAARAERDRASLGDYACTLLGAIVGERAGAFLQIGDGAIVVGANGSPTWSHVFWPQHHESK